MKLSLSVSNIKLNGSYILTFYNCKVNIDYNIIFLKTESKFYLINSYPPEWPNRQKVSTNNTIVVVGGVSIISNISKIVICRFNKTIKDEQTDRQAVIGSEADKLKSNQKVEKGNKTDVQTSPERI